MVTLHPSNSKDELDAFLRQAFNVDFNPWEPAEIFEFARNPAAWQPVQRVFKLDDVQSPRLVSALEKARKSKPPPPPPPPKQPQSFDDATINRMNAMSSAKPGTQTSIFGTDAKSGRPLAADGSVQKQADSWAGLLTGKQPAAKQGGVFGGVSQEKAAQLAEKKAAKQEKASIPPTTLHIPKPNDSKGAGWEWRPDIKYGYEKRKTGMLDFLQGGSELRHEPAVTLVEGTDSNGREYIEYANALTPARKEALSSVTIEKKVHKVNLELSHGGAQAIFGAIAKVVELLAKAEASALAAQEERLLDAFTGVDAVEAAAVEEAATIEEKFKAKGATLGQEIAEVAQQLQSDPSQAGPLMRKGAELQSQLDALPAQKAQAEQASQEKYASLRERVGKRVVANATAGCEKKRRAPPQPVMSVQLALERAKSDMLKRKLDAASSSDEPATTVPRVQPPPPQPSTHQPQPPPPAKESTPTQPSPTQPPTEEPPTTELPTEEPAIQPGFFEAEEDPPADDEPTFQELLRRAEARRDGASS